MYYNVLYIYIYIILKSLDDPAHMTACFVHLIYSDIIMIRYDGLRLGAGGSCIFHLELRHLEHLASRSEHGSYTGAEPSLF